LCVSHLSCSTSLASLAVFGIKGIGHIKDIIHTSFCLLPCCLCERLHPPSYTHKHTHTLRHTILVLQQHRHAKQGGRRARRCGGGILIHTHLRASVRRRSMRCCSSSTPPRPPASAGTAWVKSRSPLAPWLLLFLLLLFLPPLPLTPAARRSRGGFCCRFSPACS
jgi:hypothetical protein